jgi:hypothetical protein
MKMIQSAGIVESMSRHVRLLKKTLERLDIGKLPGARFGGFRFTEFSECSLSYARRNDWLDYFEFDDALPNACGIYFVQEELASPLLMYIGRATSIQRRWVGPTADAGGHILWHSTHNIFYAMANEQWAHIRDKARGSIAACLWTQPQYWLRWWEVPRDFLGLAESLLIQIHQPEWNGTRG